jgi:hypothetical protein
MKVIRQTHETKAGLPDEIAGNGPPCSTVLPGFLMLSASKQAECVTQPYGGYPPLESASVQYFRSKFPRDIATAPKNNELSIGMVIAPEKTGDREHKHAEDAVRELHRAGFKMKPLSIVGKGYRSEENPREFRMMNNHAVRHFSFLVVSLIVKDGVPGPHTPPVERRG